MSLPDKPKLSEEEILSFALKWLCDREKVETPRLSIQDWLKHCTAHVGHSRNRIPYSKECKFEYDAGTFSAPPDSEFPIILLSSKCNEKLITLFHEFGHYLDYVKDPESYDYRNVGSEDPVEQFYEGRGEELLEAFLNTYPHFRSMIKTP